MNIVVLDRDGVINHDSPDYIKSAEEWQPIDGSIEAIAAMSKAGFRVFIATNQSGLARGLFTEAQLEAMHQKMQGLVAAADGSVEKIFYCPHLPAENCACRKPATGLLDQLESYLQHSVAGAWLVGDSLKDILLGVAKHCTPLLVLTGNGLKARGQLPLKDILVFDDLRAASQHIIGHSAVEQNIG